MLDAELVETQGASESGADTQGVHAVALTYLVSGLPHALGNRTTTPGPGASGQLMSPSPSPSPTAPGATKTAPTAAASAQAVASAAGASSASAAPSVGLDSPSAPLANSVLANSNASPSPLVNSVFSGVNVNTNGGSGGGGAAGGFGGSSGFVPPACGPMARLWRCVRRVRLELDSREEAARLHALLLSRPARTCTRLTLALQLERLAARHPDSHR